MGGKTATTTQSVQIPPEVLERYRAVNVRAENVAEQPFQQYGGQFVAGLTPTQQQGIARTTQAAGMANPYYEAATGYTAAGAQDVGRLTPEQIAYYQNPYTQAVAGTTYEALRQQQQQEMNQATANAIRSGAFGGDRAGIVAANLARQQLLGTAQAMAPIYQQGYQQAVQTAAGQQGVQAQDLARRMQAGQQLAQLGTGAQAAALQGAQAQLAAGTAEQQTQQADLTARYQQFLQERGYPFQVAQFLANIAMGTGALSGSTTTTTQPAGFFSDRRLKHDVSRIGETDDGLPIYKYKYNGDDRSQIGLMAQDVEKKRPEAVGLAAAADGKYYKTVDYDRAIKRAPGGSVGKSSAQAPSYMPTGFNQSGAGAYGSRPQTMPSFNSFSPNTFPQGAGKSGVQSPSYMPMGFAQSGASYNSGALGGYPPSSAPLMGTGTLSGSAPTQTALGATIPPDVLSRFNAVNQRAEPISAPTQTALGSQIVPYGAGVTSAPTQTALGATIPPDVLDRFNAVNQGSLPTQDMSQQLGSFLQAANMGTGVLSGSAPTQTALGSPITGKSGVQAPSYTPQSGSSMGGAVSGPGNYARGGYIGGGVVDGNDLRAILESQKQFLNPYGKGGAYGTGTAAPGLGGIIPEAKLPVPKLVTASGAPAQSRSGFQEAASIGKNISDIYETGTKLRSGFQDLRKFLSNDEEQKAYGGPVGYAVGGEIDPYEMSADPIGDVVKSGKEQIRELPKPGESPKPPKSGFGELTDLAKGAASLYSAGSTLLALLPFSDRRMKDNVRPVGETYDGQTIYKYDLGGKTQIGLMAQESRPDAVHKDGLGLLHLDYDKATENARPFSYGGLVPRRGYQGGGDIESYSSEADLPALGAIEVAAPEEVERIARALKTIESSNRYGALGPVNPRTGDRAYGAYQVMGANIPSWSKEAIGRSVSPREFLENSDIQEEVAKYKINQKLDRYGNPTDVASAWFSGRPAKSAMGASDYTGTSVPTYLSRFARAYEGDLPAEGSQEAEGRASLGEVAKRETGRPGEYAGASARSATLGDVAREYAPSGFPTSEKFWVPALGFLGSMLASKSPTLGQALGEGLVGGVSAYTGLEKTRADIGKTEAEAARLGMETQKVEFNDLYERRWVQGRGWEVIDKRKPFAPPIRITDEKLNPIPGVDPKLGAVPVSSDSKDAPGSKTNVVTGGTPAATPRTEETRPPTAGSTERPERAPLTEKDITAWQPTVRAPQDFVPQGQYDYAYGTPEYRQTIAARDKGILEEQSRKGSAAYAQLTSLERMRRNIDALPDQGFTRLGAFAEQRKAFAEKANDLVGVIGGKPAFSPDEVARLEELSKDAFRLGSQLANSIGSREPGFIVQQAVGATPNISMTKQGYRLVSSGLTEAARYEKDKSNFMDDYFSRFGNLNGAEELFGRLNPYQKYAQRALANVANPEQAVRLKEWFAGPGKNAPEWMKRDAMRKFDEGVEKDGIPGNGRGVAKAILGLE